MSPSPDLWAEIGFRPVVDIYAFSHFSSTCLNSTFQKRAPHDENIKANFAIDSWSILDRIVLPLRLEPLREAMFLVYSHMLRHACGFKLANDGHDTRAIQAYLGHRSIMSTVRYTALTPNRFKNFWKD
jgi:integrase